IRDLITLEDVMEELRYGPYGRINILSGVNGLDWLEEELGEYEDDYLIIDCPDEFVTVYNECIFAFVGCICWKVSLLKIIRYSLLVLSAMSAMISLDLLGKVKRKELEFTTLYICSTYTIILSYLHGSS
ncbi:4191_t:CDS:2, partial [Funneliformis geosporum]